MSFPMFVVRCSLFALLFLTGCMTPSVHPIWSKDKNVDEPGLVGTWKSGDKDDAALCTVSKATEGYKLVVKEPGEKPADKPFVWEFEVRLVQLGDHRFADVVAPKKVCEDQDEKWGTFFIPMHLFARYTLEGDTLTVWLPDRDWVKRKIADKSLSGTTLDEDATKVPGELITSETPALQAFFKDHAADPGAFNKSVLKRQKTAP